MVCGSPNAEKHAWAVKAWVGEHNVLRVYYGRYQCCKAADTTTFLSGRPGRNVSIASPLHAKRRHTHRNHCMNTYSSLAQVIVALSVGYVWVFRFDNIVQEFRQYGLRDLTRTVVGNVKIVLATLLIAGIWYPTLVLIPAVLMGLLMVGAQYYHFKVHNPWSKRLPSLFLLALCLFIAATSLKLVS